MIEGMPSGPQPEIRRENENLQKIDVLTFGKDQIEKGINLLLSTNAKIRIYKESESPTGYAVYSPFSSENFTPLKPGDNTIGRGPDCDIVVEVLTVSKHHADIIVLDDGLIKIIDHDSANGTFLEK